MKIKFNKDQLFKLSDISSDTGLVALATVVLPAVFDKYDPAKILLGLIAVTICWIVSLIFRK